MIELHVHLEGTVEAPLALRLARRHRVKLGPALERTLSVPFPGGAFGDFVTRWKLVGSLLREGEDFADVVVDYARRLAGQGCTYAEAIFSPAEPARLGVPWDTVFGGYCDGAVAAREAHGVEVRLTPDITRSFTPEEADLVCEYAIRYRGRGVVGLGLGGFEAEYPAQLFEGVFRRAREEGLASVPHAGEQAGPASIRAALDVLAADRIRHGVRAIEDPALVAELVDRQVVLDVCPTANVLLGVVPSLELHPLPRLVASGVLCSVSTDNPAVFATSLTEERAIAARLGVDLDRIDAAAERGAVGPREPEAAGTAPPPAVERATAAG